MTGILKSRFCPERALASPVRRCGVSGYTGGGIAVLQRIAVRFATKRIGMGSWK